MLKLDASSMPFLFKILSVRTALSIQAHPDKVLAAKLHRESPDHYKDDNHKPEMAVAITPFEALCSFQPAYSILCNCRATPELVMVIGEKVVSDLDDAIEHRTVDDKAVMLALKALFGALMLAPAPLVAQQLNSLIRRIESTNEILRAPVDVLAVRLSQPTCAFCMCSQQPHLGVLSHAQQAKSRVCVPSTARVDPHVQRAWIPMCSARVAVGGDLRVCVSAYRGPRALAIIIPSRGLRVPYVGRCDYTHSTRMTSACFACIY